MMMMTTDYDYGYGEAEASPAPSPFVAPAPSRGVVFLSPPDANDTKGNGNKDGLGSQDWTLDVVSPEGLLLMDVVYRTTNWNEAQNLSHGGMGGIGQTLLRV
eukprot:jgi/Picre1/27419/NNA_000386.t1